MSEDIATAMAPYRARIDDIDRQIIDLLRARYDVIEEVAPFKFSRGIEAVLQNRVDEVRENAARMAAAVNLDENFIRHVYAQIIAHSCALEEDIMATISAQASGKKHAGQTKK